MHSRQAFSLPLHLTKHSLNQQAALRENSENSTVTVVYRSAFKLIAERHTDNISQAEVASNIGLNPYYFSKLFNEYTEMSFPAYLSSVRVQSAINLLTDERLSITDCAFMSGFQSTTTFNKVFHEVTGCTPREYRKLHHTQ